MTQKEHRQPEGGLLQSQEWAAVLRAEGKCVFEIDGIFGIVQKVPVAGQYLYVPRMTDVGVVNFEKIVQAARKKGCTWVRTDFMAEEQRAQVRGEKMMRAPHDMQPREHIMLDLTQDEDTLLKAMKSKTRYNMRLAQKKGVVVHYVTRSDDDFDQIFDAFFTMVEETAMRKGVHFHPRAHYKNIFENLSEDMVAFFVAEYHGAYIAANIVTFYNDTATYLHGATSDAHRNLMAPFLLQWEAILSAKARGCAHYDFGGVFLESGDAGKTGITRFKQGFAPQEEVMIMQGSWDIIIAPVRYYIYRVLQKLKFFLTRKI